MQTEAKTEKDEAGRRNHGTPPAWVCEDAKVTDFLVVYFTYCLVLVGWFTIRSSERIAEDQTGVANKQASIAGLQADISERQKEIARQEFLTTHRPRIIVRDVRQLDCNPGDAIEINFRVVNTGATTAHIIASSFDIWRFGIAASYKALETPQAGAENWIGNRPLASNAVFDLTYTNGQWHPGDFHAHVDQDRGVFFGGQIIYRDEIGNVRRVGILRRLDVSARRFHAVRDSDYDYED